MINARQMLLYSLMCRWQNETQTQFYGVTTMGFITISVIAVMITDTIILKPVFGTLSTYCDFVSNHRGLSVQTKVLQTLMNT
jgi:hypothetical protein